VGWIPVVVDVSMMRPQIPDLDLDLYLDLAQKSCSGSLGIWDLHGAKTFFNQSWEWILGSVGKEAGVLTAALGSSRKAEYYTVLL